jgi:hypothetical protein
MRGRGRLVRSRREPTRRARSTSEFVRCSASTANSDEPGVLLDLRPVRQTRDPPDLRPAAGMERHQGSRDRSPLLRLRPLAGRARRRAAALEVVPMASRVGCHDVLEHPPRGGPHPEYHALRLAAPKIAASDRRGAGSGESCPPRTGSGSDATLSLLGVVGADRAMATRTRTGESVRPPRSKAKRRAGLPSSRAPHPARTEPPSHSTGAAGCRPCLTPGRRTAWRRRRPASAPPSARA